MSLTYFKRYRMEIEIGRQYLPEPVLPAGYAWVPWTPALTGRHAWTKYRSFQGELDSEVFRSLSQLEGCQHLMREISQRDTFLPGTTWLIEGPVWPQNTPPIAASLAARALSRPESRESAGSIASDHSAERLLDPAARSQRSPLTSVEVEPPEMEDCATIQGLYQVGQTGSIQNVGVIPARRGLGLGRALVLRALWGFREAGLTRVSLEVTAQNTPAVNLYRSIGFRLSKTSYRAVSSPIDEIAAACGYERG